MTAAAAWLVNEDEEQTKELEAMLGESLSKPQTFADIDALASEYMRWMAGEEAEIRRYNEARDLEIARIRARYDGFRAPHEKRLALLENAVATLAERAGLGDPDAKKKSRKVGNGTYGSRRSAARVEILDAAAALAFIKRHAPHLVKVKESVGTTEVKAFYQENGALPDGCEEVPERIIYYAKVEVSDVAN